MNLRDLWIKVIRFLGVPEDEAWRQVHIHYEETIFNGIEDENKNRLYKLFFHHLESNRGARQVKYSCDRNIPDNAFVARQLEYYHTTCIPWLNGCNFEEIPSYDQSIKIENAKLKRDAEVIPLKVVK